MTNLAHRLQRTLEDVQRLAGPEFSGLGVIVWDGRSPLPIFPLRNEIPPFTGASLVPTLVSLGAHTSPFHDGFHVLTPEFEIHAPAMYFSPPIQHGISLDRSQGYGGRYVAALFGSRVPGVLSTGVLSAVYGVVVFVHGKRV